MVWRLRKLAESQTKARADLKRFSIKDAVCAVERDRVTVEDNVVSLMRQLSCVPPDCSRDGALVAFDLSDPKGDATRDRCCHRENLASVRVPCHHPDWSTALHLRQNSRRACRGAPSTQQMTALIMEVMTRNLACMPTPHCSGFVAVQALRGGGGSEGDHVSCSRHRGLLRSGCLAVRHASNFADLRHQ